jgi:predicted transcriptional regulator
MPDEPDNTDLLLHTAKIVSAHVSHNSIAPDALPALIRSVFATLAGTTTATAPAGQAEPAVPVKKSVFADHIVCLECGKQFSMLKRHLSTDHGLSPDEYRVKWALPRNYPMVAGEYAKRRSALAKKLGLGKKSAPAAAVAAPAKVKVTVLPQRKRGRPRKVA